MANEEHLNILKQGVEAWNKWREEHPDIRPDLPEADLREANLRGADLRKADLRKADLRRAFLIEADLREADFGRADLRGADLRGADLLQVDLSGALLSRADLFGANLSEALFSRADLLQANLSRADLSGADLSGADLRGALFHGTDLSGALLLQADLRGTLLLQTDLLQTDPRRRRRRPRQTRSRVLAEQPPQPVLLGASAPEAVRPGHTFTARVVAYEKSRAKKVEKLLHQLSPSARHILGIKACRWQLGTHVTIRLSGQALTTPHREQEFTWEGDHTLIDFDVTVQPRTQAGLTTLTFDVAIEDVLVARLRVDVAIRAQLPTDSVTIVRTEAARTAFASYAKEDQQRVLDHAASVRISAGLDVFLDCLALHPGEEGKPRVEKEILTRDTFLLFWSDYAKKSTWVTWEWKTYLEKRGPQTMQIHPLQSNVTPPPALEHIHVSDHYMPVHKTRVTQSRSTGR